MREPFFQARAVLRFPVSRPLGKSLVAALVLGIGGAEPKLFIDGVTAATTKPDPVPPTVEITAADGSSVKGIVAVKEGETVTLDIKVYDPRDTQGLYHDFSLQALPTNTPPGASLAFNALKGLGRYTWTAVEGDAARYPSTTITFVASNTYLGGTTKQQVTLSLGDLPTPVFSTAIPAQQTAEVGKRLKFPLTVSSPSSKVRIKASRLPPGATLGPTRKTPNTQQWTAVLKWKPKAKHTGHSYATTFTAIGKDGSTALQSTLGVTFTAATLLLQQARWNADSSQLTVAGKGPKGQSISLGFSPGGTALTNVPISVDGQGLWSHSLQVEAANAPCAVQARTGNQAATLAVDSAPAACVATPVCTDPAQWHPEDSGAPAQCM